MLCTWGERCGISFPRFIFINLNVVTISVMCVFIPSDVTFKQTKLRLYTKGKCFQEKNHLLMNLLTWWKWVCSFVVQLTKALILPNSFLYSPKYMSKVINLEMVSLALSKLKSLMYQGKCQGSEGTVERKGEIFVHLHLIGD